MRSRVTAEQADTTNLNHETPAPAQRQLSGAIHQNPRVAAQRSLIDSINTSPRVAALRSLQHEIDNSPRRIAQGRRLGAMFSANTPLQGVFLEEGKPITSEYAMTLAVDNKLNFTGEVLERFNELAQSEKKNKDIYEWISEELSRHEGKKEEDKEDEHKKRRQYDAERSGEKPPKLGRLETTPNEVVTLPAALGAQITPDQGNFKFPEALYEKVARLPLKRRDYRYQHDQYKILALQNPDGQEMREREKLLQKGLWHDEKSREELSLTVKGGILSNAAGKEVDGKVQYVLSENWGLYGRTEIPADKRAGAHTAMLAGGPVRAAGWIGARSGKIYRIGNDSGHYGPVVEQLYQLIWYLEKNGVSMEEVALQDAVAEKQHNAAEYKTWLEGGKKGHVKGKNSSNW